MTFRSKEKLIELDSYIKNMEITSQI